MDHSVFLSGLYGSLLGGLMLAGTVLALFAYEKKSANKKSDKLMNDLKSIYTEKLNQGIAQQYAKPSTGKFN